MAEKEFLGDRRRIQEEEYFQKREQELIARFQQRSREDIARRRMSERAGVADEEILRELETLGYTYETVMLLHIVPLLQMAWAEGGVSDAERALIIEAARARRIEEGSAADRQLSTWLTTRPSADFFEHTLRAISAILQIRPPDEREDSERDLLAYCMAIASASGGILGFGKVSPEEQEVFARISQAIERARGSVPPVASRHVEGHS
jgi:tellurite resistance protein